MEERKMYKMLGYMNIAVSRSTRIYHGEDAREGGQSIDCN